METTDSQTISQMNDLIRINNDRIEGYERAVNDTDDAKLKSIFYSMAQESRKFKNELLTEVIKMGGTPEEGTTVSGKVFRAWMDFKSAIAGKDRKAIISSCEFGEDAALHTYHEVIETGKLPAQYLAIVKEQHKALHQSHDKIKLMRETVKSL
ncbi:MAG: PA2169 family four-helix-bundle protein [Bacteroidetes bacterium]|nr:PA2169 family four-helix-bundle protein [Bacteroidota bacterium]